VARTTTYAAVKQAGITEYARLTGDLQQDRAVQDRLVGRVHDRVRPKRSQPFACAVGWKEVNGSYFSIPSNATSARIFFRCGTGCPPTVARRRLQIFPGSAPSSCSGFSDTPPDQRPTGSCGNPSTDEFVPQRTCPVLELWHALRNSSFCVMYGKQDAQRCLGTALRSRGREPVSFHTCSRIWVSLLLCITLVGCQFGLPQQLDMGAATLEGAARQTVSCADPPDDSVGFLVRAQYPWANGWIVLYLVSCPPGTAVGPGAQGVEGIVQAHFSDAFFAAIVPGAVMACVAQVLAADGTVLREVALQPVQPCES
jgi:hypothetical protein